MKKITAVLLSLLLALPLLAFAPAGTSAALFEAAEETAAFDTDFKAELDALKEETVTSLREEFDALTAEIDTYAACQEKFDKVEAYCDTVLEKTAALCISLRECCLQYAKDVVTENDDYSVMDDEIDPILEDAYDEIGSAIHDEIYDDIVEDFYDYFNTKVVDEASDDVDISEWLDASEAVYDCWQTLSDGTFVIYTDYTDDIYHFWGDLNDKIWDQNDEKINRIIDEFEFHIEVLKGNEEPIETEATKDVKDTAAVLKEEAEALIEENSDVDTYIENIGAIEAFYEKIEAEAELLAVRVREYAVDELEEIIGMELDFADRQDEAGYVFDEIYRDSARLMKDLIGDEILDELQDAFYKGILKDDASDEAYRLRGKNNDLYWDAYNGVTEQIDDMKEDISDLFYDLDDGFFDEDDDLLYETLNEFRALIEKLKGNGEAEAYETDLDETIAMFGEAFEALKAEIDSAEAYAKNPEAAADFAAMVVEETEALCGRLYGYAAEYGEEALNAGVDTDECCDFIDAIYDNIYDEAGEWLFDEIYDGIVEDFYDFYCTDIVEPASKDMDYDEWYELYDTVYNVWNETSDAVFELYSEFTDKSFGLYSSLNNAYFDGDAEAFEESLKAFEEEIGF